MDRLKQFELVILFIGWFLAVMLQYAITDAIMTNILHISTTGLKDELLFNLGSVFMFENSKDLSLMTFSVVFARIVFVCFSQFHARPNSLVDMLRCRHASHCYPQRCYFYPGLIHDSREATIASVLHFYGSYHCYYDTATIGTKSTGYRSSINLSLSGETAAVRQSGRKGCQ